MSSSVSDSMVHIPPTFRRDFSASPQGKSVLLSQIIIGQGTTACPTCKHYVSVYLITQALSNPVHSFSTAFKSYREAAITIFGVSSKIKAPKGMRWI